MRLEDIVVIADDGIPNRSTRPTTARRGRRLAAPGGTGVDLGIDGRAALVVAGFAGPRSGLGRSAGRRRGPGDALLPQGRRPWPRSADRCRAAGAEVETVAGRHHRARARQPAGGRPRSAAFGSIDVVVANAGGPPPAGPSRSTTPCSGGPQRQLPVGRRLARAALPLHARSGVGPDLLHRLLLGGPAGAGPRPVQRGPDGLARLGQDSRPGPGRRGERHHLEPHLSGTPRDRPHARAGGFGRRWATRPTSGRWSPSSAPSRPASSTGRRWSSTAGRPWPCSGPAANRFKAGMGPTRHHPVPPSWGAGPS